MVKLYEQKIKKKLFDLIKKDSQAYFNSLARIFRLARCFHGIKEVIQLQIAGG